MRQKKEFQVLFIIAAVMFLLPFGFRFFDNNTNLIGEESYYHARLASEIKDNTFSANDMLAFDGRAYYFDPYDFLLAFVSYAFGPEIASRILPLALGLLSVLIVFKLLQKLKMSSIETASITLLFILNPVTITVFSTSTNLALLLILYLFAIYVLLSKSKSGNILAFVLFFSVSLYGIIHTAIAIATWYACLRSKHSRKYFNAFAATSFITVLSYHLPNYLKRNAIALPKQNLLLGFISDFGGILGLSVFSLLLACIGFVAMWKFKNKHYSLLAAVLAIVFWSFFEKSLMIYSALIVSFFAGIAFSMFAKMRWKVKMLKNFSLLVLFCGLLFSTISHAVVLSEQPPSMETKEALIWLKNSSIEDGKVFSHYSKGFFIEYWSGKKALTDSAYLYAENAEEIFRDSADILTSDNLVNTKKMLQKNRVGHIMITEDMREGLVWEKPEKGLDYLLANNETFKKLYSNNFTQLWAVVPE